MTFRIGISANNNKTLGGCFYLIINHFRFNLKAELERPNAPLPFIGNGIVLCTTKLSLKEEKVSVPAYGMIINGEKVLSKDSFEVVNPATGGAFAECPKASIDQLNQAVAAAREALPQWSGLADEKRVEILNQIS